MIIPAYIFFSSAEFMLGSSPPPPPTVAILLGYYISFYSFFPAFFNLSSAAVVYPIFLVTFSFPSVTFLMPPSVVVLSFVFLASSIFSNFF